MAVIQNASLVIALDSAPVHVAVGFGVRFVVLYGTTQPSSDGPYKGEMWCVHGGRGKELGKHDYRDSRKGLEMMKRISTEEVVALVRKRLQDGAES
jgi:ADP-heptose:LPS heptosyltransferase